jgi:hypothetical protein
MSHSKLILQASDFEFHLIAMSTHQSNALNSTSLLRRIQLQQWLVPTIILHYNQASRDLQVWFW